MAVDASTRDAIDDVFYDGFSDLDDTFNDNPTLKDQRDDKPTLSPRAPKRKAAEDGDAFGLGLDEEVKIAKKRAPIAKLDEARLLSAPGIPKLRALVRSKQISRKLRLKGKGHEFNDAAKLLNYFQLWLDDLYPRAKFADALSMAEKAGHTKRMQMTRCEWINEGKPGYMARVIEEQDKPREDPDLFGSAGKGISAKHDDNDANRAPDDDMQDDSLFIPDANRTFEEERHLDPDDDELDALLAEERETTASRQVTKPTTRQEDSEGEDDLDALLAEQYTRQQRSTISTNATKEKDQAVEEEDFDDDLDALLAEQETRSKSNTHEHTNREVGGRAGINESNDKDEDEIQLPPTIPLNRQQEPDANVTNPSPDELVEENFLSSSPLPNDDLIEDDILRDEMPATTAAYTDVHQKQGEEASLLPKDVDRPSTPLQGELEEDFLSSSPIELS